MEAAGKRRVKAIHRLEKVVDSHAEQFIEMNRHLEDLDNRRRRNNIRVRLIPETVDPDQIIPALQRVFNSLLERQEDMDIEFVRAHRALRARGPDTAPPRDIICCLQSYPLKEEMRKARRNDQIVFNGEHIMLFQDLSQVTLRNRRALRPLLDKLRELDLRYTWRFPFALVVKLAGKQHILRSPAVLPDFCAGLGLDRVELPDWYQEFALPPPTRSPHSTPSSTPEKQFSKRMKHGRGGGQHSGTPNRRQMPHGSQVAE